MDEMIIRDRIIEYIFRFVCFILETRNWDTTHFYVFKNKIPFSFRLKLIGDEQSYKRYNKK